MKALLQYHTLGSIVRALCVTAVIICAASTAVARIRQVNIDTNGAPVYAWVSEGFISDCCDPHNPSNRVASQVADEYGRGLMRLIDKNARLVSGVPGDCTSGQATVVLRYRLVDKATNGSTTVGLAYDSAGQLAAMTFDRPIKGLNGIAVAAGTPVPIEQVLRLVALARKDEAVVGDLTILKSKYSFTYKSPNSTDAVAKTAFTAILPTSFTNFNQVSRFTVTATAPGTNQPYVHTFKRYNVDEKGDKYYHYFLPVNAPLDTKPIGSFIASIKGSRMLIAYAMTLNNTGGKIIATDAYETIRSNMATNKPVKFPSAGYVQFDMDSETHYATNILVITKVTKTNLSGKSVKMKPTKERRTPRDFCPRAIPLGKGGQGDVLPPL